MIVIIRELDAAPPIEVLRPRHRSQLPLVPSPSQIPRLAPQQRRRDGIPVPERAPLDVVPQNVLAVLGLLPREIGCLALLDSLGGPGCPRRCRGSLFDLEVSPLFRVCEACSN